MDATSAVVLSFCIPTYGQPHHVRKTLDSLIGQDMDGVEIVIRDDSQDMETERIVAEYLTRLPIRYFHLSKEGVDRAFLFLSKEARGAFVWWFGDDMLEPGTMARVVEFLRCNSSIDFVYINSTDLGGENYSIQQGGSRYFVDRNEVLSTLKDQLGFCSAMLFKKETLSLGLAKAESCVGTFWVTFFLVLHVLSSGKTFYFLDGRNFLSEPKPAGEARWYDSFLVHGINFTVVARKFKNNFNRSTMRKMLGDKFSSSWHAVIVERARGFSTGFAAATPRWAKMFRLYWNYPELYMAIPMLLIPRPVLRGIYSLYKKVGSVRG